MSKPLTTKVSTPLSENAQSVYLLSLICINVYLHDIKLGIKQYSFIEYKLNYKEQIWNKMYLFMYKSN